MPRGLFLLKFVLAGSLFLGGAAHAYDFTPMNLDALNRRLQNCLDKLGCKITSSMGVCRKPGRTSPAQSATSCHLRCRAIDFSAVRCTKTGTSSNNANLNKIAQCLRGKYYFACYDGKGGCHAAHRDHLHFGANESYRCEVPMDKSGDLNNVYYEQDFVSDESEE